MRTFRRALRASAVYAPLAAAAAAGAHGFVGDRFFPPTITSDDPFAVDELALPTVTAFNTPAEPGTPESRTFDFGFEFDKEIFPHLAIGVSDDYLAQTGHGGPSAHGWGNVALSAKYELLHDDAHEFILSVGVGGTIGHSGNVQTADAFSSVEPTLYYGKGFGDLPGSVDLLRPLAVTGTLGQSFATVAAEPNALDWAFALEYSLPYLQAEVRDVGLPHPLGDLIPVCEFTFSTQENRARPRPDAGHDQPRRDVREPVLPGRGRGPDPGRPRQRGPRRPGRAVVDLHRRLVPPSVRPPDLRWRRRMTMTTRTVRTAALWAAALTFGLPAAAGAHAFLDHADPKVGSAVAAAPPRVAVHFTQSVEPAFSTVRVSDADGKQVDRADVRVDPKDPATLSVGVPDLPAGTYKVEWKVTSVDTHRTHGTFAFTVQPKG